MISIQNFSSYKVVRYLADLIEPFMIKQIEKENHTFFVYRCSDYNNLNHLLICHKFKIKNKKFTELLEKYWTSIDLIQLKINNMPEYTADKKYFDTLRKLNIEEKDVIDIELYEVKMFTGKLKPMLSVNTYNCIKEFKKLGKDMRIVSVKLDGKFKINYSYNDFDKNNFLVKTHYGRKGYSIGLGSNLN